ncbi:MAG: DUF3786 domain-containing protein [Candidatus Omnitrophica bacterium]|nr:DUF3786 domain-containing protein [Candidatus Omnitrophota bacterium]
MEYEVALNKAWQELAQLAGEKTYSLRFLGDDYEVDVDKETVFSLSCNVPAKVYTSILILHYLIRKANGLPSIKGEWISFKELVGGEGYYPNFKKRVINTITRKYGKNPDSLLALVERFKAKKAELADVSVVLDTIEESAPFLITLWRGDEEFGPEANLLFDKSIADIFGTEDIVVLSEVVAHSI